MNDHMKEAERLLSEYGDAVSDVVVFAQDPAGYSMRVEATRAALLAHIQRGAVPEALDPEFLIGYLEVREDWRGREFLIERIRQAAAPDQFRDATKMMAAPAEVPMPKPVAYGFGNTAITGHTNRLMMVRIDIPGGDQYAGAFWHPLVLADEAHTYGVACRAAGEAAGYARGLRDAVRDADIEALRLYVRALCKAVDAATDFAGTVAGGASWWDDVWADHTAALDRARDRLSQAALRGEAKP